MKAEELGVWLLERTGIDRLAVREQRSRAYAEVLYPRENREQVQKKLWGNRLVIALILVFSVILAWFASSVSEPGQSLLNEGKYLSRQGEDTAVDIEVRGESEQGEWEKKIRLNLKQREFTEEEKFELEQKLEEYVAATLPGDNSSLEKVTESLVFVSEVPDTEMVLDWSWDDTYIRENGGLVVKEIPPEGVDTDIMLQASWRNWKKIIYYHVHLMAVEQSAEIQQIREVKSALKGVLKEKADQEIIELPEEVGKTQLTYQMEDGGRDYTLLYLVFGVILIVPILARERHKKQLAAREDQMMLDYPGIVNQVMLLLGAGLTFRGAVERITSEYEKNRQREGGIRYAYEEMCILMQEMRDGVSEGRAVENFGRKCRIMPYLRFSSVITQNLKKGSDGILDLLSQESVEAMQQRRERVLSMGERAGTKLLFPMIIMLGLVMGIIMFPALMTL